MFWRNQLNFPVSDAEVCKTCRFRKIWCCKTSTFFLKIGLDTTGKKPIIWPVVFLNGSVWGIDISCADMLVRRLTKIPSSLTWEMRSCCRWANSRYTYSHFRTVQKKRSLAQCSNFGITWRASTWRRRQLHILSQDRTAGLFSGVHRGTAQIALLLKLMSSFSARFSHNSHRRMWTRPIDEDEEEPESSSF